MAHYRLTELDLSNRIELALEMLKPIPERPWGLATELARRYGISRTLLYELRDQAWRALDEALSPHSSGPQPQPKALRIDKAFLERAVTILPMLTGSVRSIQQGLELLFDVRRSVGYISQTLQKAGEAAAAYNATLSISKRVLAEADEIFQGRHPCLTVVDGRSFLVLNLTPAKARDGTTWGVTFLELQERGIQFQDLACDRARGIRNGAEEAHLRVPVRPDLFHLLREAHTLSRRLERRAYQAIETAERARRAEREAQTPHRRQGRPLKVKVSRAEAEAEEEKSIETYDLWRWLLSEMRQALDPITPDDNLMAVAEAQATCETAVELMKALGRKDVTSFAQKLSNQMSALLAPLTWLERRLAPWRQELDADAEMTIVWAWQHQQELEVEIEQDFPESLQPVVQAIWEGLDLFHRSSSLAEALHSWLRPYLQIHRGMPQWLLPLLQLFWNHHPFQRGKRAGQSPLELASMTDVPSLSDVLDRLLEPKLLAQAV